LRFSINSDVEITVAFEPAGEIYHLTPREPIVVEWSGEADDGEVYFQAGDIVVYPPSAPGTTMRAWRSDGSEIYVGLDSGPEAN
jgi:hypothetical protein